MVVLMLLPAVTGATLPGRDRAQKALTPSRAAASKSTPPGLEAQVNDQAARLQICQFRLPQNADRDGIDHQIIAAKPALQLPGVLHAVAAVLCPGQVGIPAGRHADPGLQARQPVGQHPAQTAVADHQNPGAVEGNGQLLHSQLDGPLCGGHRLSERTPLFSAGGGYTRSPQPAAPPPPAGLRRTRKHRAAPPAQPAGRRPGP